MTTDDQDITDELRWHGTRKDDLRFVSEADIVRREKEAYDRGIADGQRTFLREARNHITYYADLANMQEQAIQDAYLRGRADRERELLGDRKPDGWCFRHPEYGWFWKESDDPYHKEEMIRLGYTCTPVKLIEIKEPKT